jgi:hypothetical protein
LYRTGTGPTGTIAVSNTTAFVGYTETITLGTNERVLVSAQCHFTSGANNNIVAATLVRSTTTPPTAPGAGGINLATRTNTEIANATPTTYMVRASPLASGDFQYFTVNYVDLPGAGSFNYSLRVQTTAAATIYPVFVNVIRIGL